MAFVAIDKGSVGSSQGRREVEVIYRKAHNDARKQEEDEEEEARKIQHEKEAQEFNERFLKKAAKERPQGFLPEGQGHP